MQQPYHNFYAPLRTLENPIPRAKPANAEEALNRFARMHIDWYRFVRNRVGYSPTRILRRMSELFEEKYTELLQTDPDPHDDRVPVRGGPPSTFSMSIKALCTKDDFLSYLCGAYAFHSDREISTVALRLLTSVLPHIELDSIISDIPDFCQKLYRVAMSETSSNSQRAYAMGLIAACTDTVREGAYSSENARLIQIAIVRLKEIQLKMYLDHMEEDRKKQRPITASFAEIRLDADPAPNNQNKVGDESNVVPNTPPVESPKKKTTSSTCENTVAHAENGTAASSSGPPCKKAKMVEKGATPHQSEKPETENPGSQCQKVKKKPTKLPALPVDVIDNGLTVCKMSDLNRVTYGTYSLEPLTAVVEQRLILIYLAALGEFNDVLVPVFEHQLMDSLLFYLDLNNTRNVRLTHDAVRVIGSLMVHRKFAFAFIAKKGIERLLCVVRETMASLAVAPVLFYISSSSDVMETVCGLPDPVLDKIVDYGLYLLSHSYESGRANAAMFFTYGLQFEPILVRFDKRRGILAIYNYISTLSLVQEGPACKLSPDDVESSMQCLLNALVLLKCYLECHIHLKFQTLVKTNPDLNVPCLLRNTPSTKSLKLDYSMLREAIQYMLKLFASGFDWEPIADLEQLEFLQLLTKVLNMVYSNSYSGRVDIIDCILHFAWIVTTLPNMRRAIFESFTDPDEQPSTESASLVGRASIFRIVMEICNKPTNLASADCLQSALTVVSNLLNSPLCNNSAAVGIPLQPLDNESIWREFRNRNGIMMLIDRVDQGCAGTNSNYPTKDLMIRDIACEALCGLTRCERVRELLAKLPLISGDKLLAICKKVAEAPFRAQHDAFIKQARSLIEKVLNLKIPDGCEKDFTYEKIVRANIIANTRYDFRDLEMLQLTHDYLDDRGLQNSASCLSEEAGLQQDEPDATNDPEFVHSSSNGQPLSVQAKANRGGQPMEGRSVEREPVNPSVSAFRPLPSYPTSSVVSSGGNSFGKPAAMVDKILGAYFSGQHSRCKHPKSICAPFSLYQEHRCANYSVKPRLDFASRFVYQGYNRIPQQSIQRAHLQSIYSKFALHKVIPNKNRDAGPFTCCAFSTDDEHILLGTTEGCVLWINAVTEEIECRQMCHPQGSVTDIVNSKDGAFLVTSSRGSVDSILWSVGESPAFKTRYADTYHARFPNTSMKNLLTTAPHGREAKLYDLETGTQVQAFCGGENSHRYVHNVATFDYTDSLIMNDGLLFDYRAGDTVVHRFDKLNKESGGVFHPDNMSIIVNSEVYDMRTYSVMHHVPAFDNAKIVFNKFGNIAYTVRRAGPEDDDDVVYYRPYFMTLDATNYTVIASSTPVKRSIYDIALDHSERRVALVEKTPNEATPREDRMSVCRVFDIGRVRDEDEPRTFHDHVELGEDVVTNPMSETGEDITGTVSPSDSMISYDGPGVADVFSVTTGNSEDSEDSDDSDDSAPVPFRPFRPVSIMAPLYRRRIEHERALREAYEADIRELQERPGQVPPAPPVAPAAAAPARPRGGRAHRVPRFPSSTPSSSRPVSQLGHRMAMVQRAAELQHENFSALEAVVGRRADGERHQQISSDESDFVDENERLDQMDRPGSSTIILNPILRRQRREEERRREAEAARRLEESDSD